MDDYKTSNSSSNGTEGPCQSPPETRFDHNHHENVNDPSVPAGSSMRSRLRRRHSAPPTSTGCETRNKPPTTVAATTVVIVPHYGFGDPDPTFASNLNLPSGYEDLRTVFGQVYDDFRSEEGSYYPDGMWRRVSRYLTDVNQQLSARREERIRNGRLPPDAEAVELRLAPREDYGKLRDYVDGLTKTANKREERSNQSKDGTEQNEDLPEAGVPEAGVPEAGVPGAGIPEAKESTDARERFERIYEQFSRR